MHLIYYFVMTTCTYILNFMCVKFNSLFEREMKVYYVTQVLQQGINIKTNCNKYILEFGNMKSHLLKVYLGAWVKIEIVFEYHVC